MDSFFFVPGNKLDKIESILSLGVHEIIIDLEDAVRYSERELIVHKIISDAFFLNFYIRLPLYNFDNKVDKLLLEKLIAAGFRKFVFPKIDSATDFDLLLPCFKEIDISIILLVETPVFFLQVQDVLFKYKKYFKGIGIGSHDFMSAIGGVHTLSNIDYIRQHILYLARAINISAIDIASMELRNADDFKEEIKNGFDKGYDAKFIIHPWQLSVLQNMQFYSKKDYEWALTVEQAFLNAGSHSEFNPITVNGQVIERPHLNKMDKILKYYKNESK